MQKLKQFLTTTLLGGLMVLLPLLLLYLMVDERLDLVVMLATPISSYFPDEHFTLLGDPFWMALLLLLIAAFICGLALRSETLKRAGRWVEDATLGKVAVYRAIKGLAHGMIGSDDSGDFPPDYGVTTTIASSWFTS